MATVRRDGSPRISGMEIQFDDERVTFGMMDGSMKALDIQRDPRVAFHSPSVDPPDGDDGGGGYEVDIEEVALTYLVGGELVIESWHLGVGHRRRTRT